MMVVPLLKASLQACRKHHFIAETINTILNTRDQLLKCYLDNSSDLYSMLTKG
jgi:hypothetical protein